MAWWLSGAVGDGPVGQSPAGIHPRLHWQTSIPGGFSTQRHLDSIAALGFAKLSAGYSYSRRVERGIVFRR